MGKNILNILFDRETNGKLGDVLRGTSILIVGSLIGRIVTIATIPILTRIYSPDNFAVLAVFLALVVISAPIVTLRYVTALPLANQDLMAINLLAASILMLLALSSTLTVFLYLWHVPLLTLLSMESLIYWWWVIPLGVVISSTYEALTLWATRQRAYTVISQGSMLQSTLSASLKIALGLFALQSMGLIFGQIIGQIAGAARHFASFAPKIINDLRLIRLSRMRRALWYYRSFPIWQTPSYFLMTFSLHAPVLLMSAIYDLEVVGYFSLATMIVSLPVNLIGYAAGQAFFAEASKLGRRNSFQIRQMLSMVTRRLLLLAIIPAILLLTLAETIFPIAFGTSWRPAGEYAQALSVCAFFQFIQTPNSRVFTVVGSHYKLMLLNALRLSVVLAVFGSAKLFGWHPGFTVWAYSLALSCHYLFGILLAYRTLPTTNIV